MAATPQRAAARRYARALFEAARDAGALDAVAADVELLGQVVGDPEVASWLADPRVELARKAAALERALGEGCHPLVRRLLAVVARRRRHAVLADLPGVFQEELDREQGRLRGVLESASPLEEPVVRALQESFGRRTGQVVLLEPRVVPELLAGVRVTLGGVRYDGSARGRLERLGRHLLQAELGA